MMNIEIDFHGKRNEGMFLNRTKGDFPQARRERAFMEGWKWENENHNTLEGLFTTNHNPNSPKYEEPKRVLRISKRHRFMVATVIQWLGSNVGFAFVEKALNQAGYQVIKKDK